MSRGHVAATHNRSVYADPHNCAVCRSQFEERNGISYERAQERSMEQFNNTMWKIGGWVAAFFVIGLILMAFEGIASLF